ncbi:MAG: hypothetical protein IJR45_01450 [Firmicutes bacterium]|nr:hypothetical protein [Bacillota bacterium]MBQ9604058.1 hypothetical protein [Bacillota bacterium]
MIQKNYKMAGRVISIDSLHRYTHDYCADYLYTGSEKPDIYVEITQKDIDFEREQSIKTDEAEGFEPYDYGDDYLESLAVYRSIAEQMLDFGAFLFHGSVIAVDGNAYIFTAKSGTGKSTHTRLWRELLGEKAVMVNDDKPLIRITETAAVACGTPYNGKHCLGSNIEVPIKAVCILTRSPENFVEPMSPADAFPTLYTQIYRPETKANLTKTLDLMDGFLTKTKIYKGGFNMDISAAELAYRIMSE